MRANWYSGLSLLFWQFIFTALAEDKYESRQSILESLLNSTEYDSSIAPDFELDTPTNVTIQLYVVNIYSVSETDMDFSVDVYFRQMWVDKRLSYKNRSGLEWLELDNKLMQNVWVPDTFFANEKKAYTHQVTVPNKMMHVYRNGTILYSMRLSLTLSCEMDLQKYPLDEQCCPVVIESYGYTVDNILFKWHPDRPIILEVKEMPQFRASPDAKFEDCSKEYAGKFACLKAQIHLRRKVGYYLVQIFIPSILIVVLSWVSFWVDVDSVPARISLGVLTVLTMTTQSSGARQSLPHVSYVKAMDVWMSTCLAFVFAALLEYAYVNVLFRRRQTGTVKDDVIELHSANGKTPSPVARYQSSRVLSKRVDKISRVAFPAVYIIFNIGFWTYYTLSPNTD